MICQNCGFPIHMGQIRRQLTGWVHRRNNSVFCEASTNLAQPTQGTEKETI